MARDNNRYALGVQTLLAVLWFIDTPPQTLIGGGGARSRSLSWG